MTASVGEVVRGFIQNVKKITNGFKVLYQDYKLIASWKEKHQLTWKEMRSYQLHPSAFQKSKFAAVFQRSEIEKIKETMHSLRKISGFFVVQLVPIIGYIPIGVAIIYPRHILTSHFWDNEQKEQFLLQCWQEKLTMSQNLYYQLLEFEDNTLTDETFTTSIAQRKSLFQNNLPKKSPFPYTISPFFSQKYYLVMLLQSQGIFSAAPPSLLFLLPRRYLKSKLQSHLHEIINDDYILQKQQISIRTLLAAEEGGKEEVQRLKFLRGFHPSQDDSHYFHYWQQSETIKSIKDQLELPLNSLDLKDQSSFPLNFAKPDKTSSKDTITNEELFFFRIIWNSILSKSPIQYIPSSKSS